MKDEWTHLILEAICMRKFGKYEKGSKYCYEIVDLKNFKTKKILNTKYDPKYRTPKMPSYCPMRKNKSSSPKYVCFDRNCPFLGLTEASEKDRKIMLKAWFEKIRKEESKWREKSKKQ